MTDLRKAAEMAIEDYHKGDDDRLLASMWLLSKALSEGVKQEIKLYDDGVDTTQERVDETEKCRHEWVGLTDQEMSGLCSVRPYRYVSALEIERRINIAINIVRKKNYG